MTINLEKELLKQNRKVATPKELLAIKEYDRLSDIVEDDALSRIGLNSQLIEGREVKNTISELAEQTAKFEQQRVFHISQIESLCKKYMLRFLPTKYYKGTIDNQLPLKIQSFEIANQVRMNENNSYIVAPKGSFRLEEKPKDPLLFYKINEEYFFLIHKWGNDLSVLRKFKKVLYSPLFCFLSVLAVTGYLSFFGEKGMVVSFFISGGWMLFYIICGFIEKKWMCFKKYESDDWRSNTL